MHDKRDLECDNRLSPDENSVKESVPGKKIGVQSKTKRDRDIKINLLEVDFHLFRNP
jgi:hypothetical protein